MQISLQLKLSCIKRMIYSFLSTRIELMRLCESSKDKHKDKEINSNRNGQRYQ
jgi:hypothetical protein